MEFAFCRQGYEVLVGQANEEIEGLQKNAHGDCRRLFLGILSAWQGTLLRQGQEVETGKYMMS